MRILVCIVGLACVSSLAFSQDNLEFPFPAAVPVKDVTSRPGPVEFLIFDSQFIPTSGPPEPASVAVVAQSENNAIPAASNAEGASTLLQAQLQSRQQSSSIGTDFYRTSDDFSQGLVIEGKGVAMKVGGYVKLDLIQDLNAIDSPDIFDVNSITRHTREYQRRKWTCQPASIRRLLLFALIHRTASDTNRGLPGRFLPPKR